MAEIYIEARPDIGGMEGAMEGAKAMIAQLQQGAPFSLLAQQFSSASSAANGGDIGWVSEGELRSELNDVLLQMEPGALSTPILVPGGIYVIALVDKRVSESETVYKLKQINFPISDPSELDAAKSAIASARDLVTSCDTIASDVKQIEGLQQADMGELKAGEIAEPILDRLALVDVGQLTETIETPSSVAAVLVCDRRVTGSNIPTRDQIEDRLIDQQLAQASKRHLRDLRRQASIIVR